MSTDPRGLGGDIIGGGTYDEGTALVDLTNAVLLDSASVTVVLPKRGGVTQEEPMVCLLLTGRVNQSQDRAKVLFTMDEDGAAAIVAELLGLASRAGTSDAFMQKLDERIKAVPK